MAQECESYAVTASFGAYLNRQLGLGFYRALLYGTGIEDSARMLEAAIQAQRPDSGTGRELRRFATAAAGLVPLAAGLAEFSLPARTEEGFVLPAIDPASFGNGYRGLPRSVPPYLQALASFPVARESMQGTYSELVRVPPGTTLTVVVN